MPARRRWTKELLQEIVPKARSFYDVLRLAGVRIGPGLSTHVKKRVIEYGLDTSHFIGAASNRGKLHKGGSRKLHWTEMLVVDRQNGLPEKSERLRRALMESGVLFICALCGLGPSWQGQFLMLQVDHINGQDLDNRRSNLRFLCPNCHTQTSNFAGQGKPRHRTLSGNAAVLRMQ